MFRFNQTIIREPTVCALLKLQYWHQLKYFITEVLSRAAACHPNLYLHNGHWNRATTNTHMRKSA